MAVYTLMYETGEHFIYHRFQIIPDSVKFGGWAKARLIQIARVPDEGDAIIENYDPKIHLFNSGHYMARPYTTRLTKIKDTIKVYWDTEVRYANRNHDFNLPQPVEEKKEEKEEEEEEDYIYSKCKTCGMRVGAHGMQESRMCGLI